MLDDQEVSADGIAVDWVHKNIYVTDSKEQKVKMISWRGEYSKTLVTEEIDQPRAIAVTPSNG